MSLIGNKAHRKNYQNKQKKSQQNTKGYWPYSFFQKPEKGGLTINEQKIKSNLFHGSLDPTKIRTMIDGSQSIDQIVLQKSKDGECLNSREKIILSSYLDKRGKELQFDLDNLEKHKLNAIVKTDEGRLRKLFMVAQYQLDKGDDEMVYYVYQKISEFSISTELAEEFSAIISRIKSKLLISMSSLITTIFEEVNILE